MSTALAIAGVSAVLKDLLNTGVIDNRLSGVVGEVTVSALPPDRVLDVNVPETSRINLFMYHATPNQGWRNTALPSRDSSGARTSNPPLALDLHYLLTTYGASEFHCEILLGYALQLLHETPVLTRDAIATALTPPTPITGAILPPELQALAAAELADQVEQIRLTPETLNLEEISKLWTAIQSHYRPTAAYQASVVLIESRRSARSALPVANDKRRIYVVPFRMPAIERVASITGEREPIVIGSTLEIRGRDLLGEITSVAIDGIEFPVAPNSGTHYRLLQPLIGPLPAGLYAGVKGVQVLQRMPMGEPPQPHRGVESNAAGFVLRPTIANGPSIPAGDLTNVTTSVVGGVSVRNGLLRVALSPNIGRNQRLVLLLNESNPAPNTIARAYTFFAPASNGAPDGVADVPDVRVPFTGVVPGTYLVRVQVDGAESVLATNPSGLFVSPSVVIA
jgi:hypothetical protein